MNRKMIFIGTMLFIICSCVYANADWNKLKKEGTSPMGFPLMINQLSVGYTGDGTVNNIIVAEPVGIVEYWKKDKSVKPENWLKIQEDPCLNGLPNQMSVSYDSDGNPMNIVIGNNDGTVFLYTKSNNSWEKIDIQGSSAGKPCVNQMVVDFDNAGNARTVVVGNYVGSVLIFKQQKDNNKWNLTKVRSKDAGGHVNQMSASFSDNGDVVKIVAGFDNGGIELGTAEGLNEIQKSADVPVNGLNVKFSSNGDVNAIIAGMGDGTVNYYSDGKWEGNIISGLGEITHIFTGFKDKEYQDVLVGQTGKISYYSKEQSKTIDIIKLESDPQHKVTCINPYFDSDGKLQSFVAGMAIGIVKYWNKSSELQELHDAGWQNEILQLSSKFDNSTGKLKNVTLGLRNGSVLNTNDIPVNSSSSNVKSKETKKTEPISEKKLEDNLKELAK
jgi:hypothetical protein